MRVLWLTNTPVGASKYFNQSKTSGGWMSSLENYIKKIDNLTLGVCFFYNASDEFKFEFETVTYYPVKTKNNSLLGKIGSKLFNRLDDSNVLRLRDVIKDFKPDVVQLFGTESGLGEILKELEIPHIIHIQGLISPCLEAWFPKGVSQQTILNNSSLKNRLLKKGVIGEYYKSKKIALREERILSSATNFFGRTDWDKSTVALYNKKAAYYHCEELLRSSFFEAPPWSKKESKAINLVTTINPNIYKGLEIILRTSFLLKEKAKVDFRWVIAGMDDNNSLVKVIEQIENKKFKDNNVVFAGYQKEDSLIKLLLDSDLFIHPSHIDNSPNSVCEAMLLGMPIIAGRVGGVPSIINNRVDGVLYNSEDSFELAGTIINLFAKPDTLLSLGTKAREKAIKRHDAKEIVKRIIETYNELIAKEEV